MGKKAGRDVAVGAVAALALLTIALIVMALGGESGMFSRRVTYRVVFPDSEGLLIGSPVRVSGVQVGGVTGIRLPTDPKAQGIEVRLGVSPAYAQRIRQGSRASLRYLQFLSGEKYVDVSPGDPALPELPEESVLPVLEETKFFQQGQDIAENLNQITLSLRSILGPLERGEGLLGELIHNPEFGKDGLAHAKATLENLEVVSRNLREGRGLVGKLLVDPSLSGVPDDLKSIASELSRITAAINRHEGALGDLTDREGTSRRAITDLGEAAASLRRSTARLETKEGLVGRLLNDTEYSEKVASDLEAILARLRSVADKVDSGQGTLGALVNERVLHDGMEEIVAGVGDDKFSRWLLRHYQKKGIEAEEEKKDP